MHYKVLPLLIMPLLGATLEINGVKSTYLFNGQEDYTINSKTYINNFSKVDLKFLLNKEKFMLKNNFYKNGTLEVKKNRIYFEKAYKLGGKLYLFNIKGYVNDSKISAKSAVYYKKKLILQKCEIRTKSRVLRRKKYIIKL